MMKTSLPGFAASLLITTFLATSIPGRAQAPSPAQSPPPSMPMTGHAPEDRPKTPLAEQMSGIAKDFRSMRKVVNDPAQKDVALQLARDMENRATKAKEFDPIKTKDIPAADRDQFLVDYRKQIDGLIADFQKLEAAVQDGKTSDASALLDKLQADKREGHKKFNAEDH